MEVENRTLKEIARDELYNYLFDSDIATGDELGMAIHFGGWSLETMQEVLYYKTGYRTLEQFREFIDGDEE